MADGVSIESSPPIDLQATYFHSQSALDVFRNVLCSTHSVSGVACWIQSSGSYSVHSDAYSDRLVNQKEVEAPARLTCKKRGEQTPSGYPKLFQALYLHGFRAYHQKLAVDFDPKDPWISWAFGCCPTLRGWAY